jgi:hypothetical protein
MSEGAGIKCAVCSARPYPELSLPAVVRQCDDLMKVGDRWFCDLHRPAQPPRKPRPPALPFTAKLKAIRTELGAIARRVETQDISAADRLLAALADIDALIMERLNGQ